MNKKIIMLLTFVGCLFLSLAIYLSVFYITQGEKLEQSLYNQRLTDEENKVLRGSIYDKNGILLAESKKTENGYKRVYPYGKLYTHVIGYNSDLYGKSKIELSFNDYLSGNNEIGEAFNIASSVAGEEKSGFDLTLTIDHKLQSYASDLLSGRNGCIILMDGKSGAVRALYSNPTFNPDSEYLLENWETLASREDAPFLARATGGLYAPGSTWKIITAAQAIENSMENEIFNDEGKIILGGREYKNSKEKAYGEIGLYDAFKFSSNVVFASIGARLGKDGISDYDDFGFEKKIEFDIPLEKNILSDKNHKMSEADIASTAIGQGKLMVSPMYMTLIASSVANQGKMVEPYLVESADKGSFNAYSAREKRSERIMTKETADKIKEMMALCVSEGTGMAASVSGLSVYGKTGTAQNETDKSHDWFIGFCENEIGEQGIICVMLEYSGRGSGETAYMAGRMLSYWMK